MIFIKEISGRLTDSNEKTLGQNEIT